MRGRRRSTPQVPTWVCRLRCGALSEDVLRGERTFLRHGSRDAQPRRSARHSGPTGPSDIVLHSPAGPEERSRGSALYALPPPGTSESERTEDGDTDSDAAPVIRTSRTALALAAVAHGTSPGSACRRAVRCSCRLARSASCSKCAATQSVRLEGSPA